MMRLLFTSIISLALGVSVLGSLAPQVYAQSGSAAPTTAQAPEPGVGDSIAAQARASEAARAAGGNTGNPDEKKPISFSALSTVNKGFVSAMSFIMMLCAWLLAIAIIVLDNAVLYTVVYMGSYISHLSAIGVTWEILRNIGNIALIFGFLAIGIAIILSAEWYGLKKMIPRLIMGAILLNFSLFMAEAVIDVGNFLATNIYTQINGGVPAGAKLSVTGSGTAPGTGITGRAATAIAATAAPVTNEAISSKIMNQLGLQRIYGEALNGNKALLTENNSPLVAVLGILLFTILAFVMFFLSFILITRFIYLIYAIITAPVGVVGFVIPQFKGVGNDWFKNLVTQSMSAPVMFLLLYVALRIITDASFLGFGASPEYAGAIPDVNGNTNFSGFANIMISFFVAIGALLGVIYGTKKIGAVGSSWATKTAGKFSFGLAAAGLRSTAGWGSQWGAKAIRQSRFRSTSFGRMAATTLDKGATGSFDIRSSKYAALGLKQADIEAGEAQKGGYKGQVDKNVKAHEAYVKTIQAREKTGEEVRTIASAEKEKATAEAAHKAAKEVHSAAVQEHSKHKEEVERFEKEVKQNAASGIIAPQRDQETKQKLETARTAMNMSGENVKSLKINLEKVEAELGEKTKAHEVIKKGIDRAAGEQGGREEYGKNLQKNPIRNWALFGTGGSDAAKKIIKEATKTKSKDEEALEILKETIKKNIEAESGGEKPKETKSEEGAKEKK